MMCITLKGDKVTLDRDVFAHIITRLEVLLEYQPRPVRDDALLKNRIKEISRELIE